jgi:DnaJ-domain-containing protein 1
MRLPSRLAASTLGDLLGALHRSRTTGLLELYEVPGAIASAVPGRRHRIHLFCGLVAGVETSLPHAPLGRVLKTKGLLRDQALADLLARIAAGDPRLAGEILVEDGHAPKAIVDMGLRAQLREKIDVVYTLKDADVRFHTARPLSEAARRAGLLASTEFLHGRPRARDRVARAWPSATPGRPFGEPERRVSPNRPWASRAQSGFQSAFADAHENENDEYRSDEESPFSEVRYQRQERPSAARDHLSDEPRAKALRLLGLDREADLPAIRKAFRDLAVKLHPDRFATAPAATREQKSALFAEVSAAYHLLVA